MSNRCKCGNPVLHHVLCTDTNTLTKIDECELCYEEGELIKKAFILRERTILKQRMQAINKIIKKM
jgi:hypothetical protein